MQSLGMPLRSDDAPEDRQHRVHINHLWNEFVTFVNTRGGAHYAAIMTGTSNPFDGWDINQRYHHRSSITQEVLEKHQQDAITAMQVLQAAILNGDILNGDII